MGKTVYVITTAYGFQMESPYGVAESVTAAEAELRKFFPKLEQIGPEAYASGEDNDVQIYIRPYVMITGETAKKKQTRRRYW